MKQYTQKSLCVSVFKNGQNKTTSKEYTKAWIELINSIEKCKRVQSERQ